MTNARWKKTLWAGGMLAGAGGALAAYTLGVEPLLLEVTHPEIFLPRLPTALDGMTVLLLADPHISEWGKREEKLLALLETLEPPDLIVWAGDFLQGGSGMDNARKLTQGVSALFPGCPAYAILGNAEHKVNFKRRRRFVYNLERDGIRFLINRHEMLTLRGERLILAGTDDPYYNQADLAAALVGADTASTFTLLLAHSPQIATQAARAGVDLMLSGHTHGGQVRLPLVGPFKTQNPLARTLDCGLFDRARLSQTLGRDSGGDLVTYISRGIGVANIPRVPWLAPRFLCRPRNRPHHAPQRNTGDLTYRAAACYAESVMQQAEHLRWWRGEYFFRRPFPSRSRQR